MIEIRRSINGITSPEVLATVANEDEYNRWVQEHPEFTEVSNNFITEATASLPELTITSNKDNTTSTNMGSYSDTRENNNYSFGDWLNSIPSSLNRQWNDVLQYDPVIGQRRVDNYRRAESMFPNLSQKYDVLNNALEAFNIAGSGIPNKLSISQLWGFGRDLINGKNALNSWYNMNSGFFTDEYVAKNPVLATTLNLVGDIATPWALSKLNNSRLANAYRFNRAINKEINNWDGTYPRRYFQDPYSMYSTNGTKYRVGGIEGTPQTILETPIPADNLYPQSDFSEFTYLGDKYSPTPSEYSFGSFDDGFGSFIDFNAFDKPKLKPVKYITRSTTSTPYRQYTLNPNGTYSEVLRSPQQHLVQTLFPKTIDNLLPSQTGFYPYSDIEQNLRSWQNSPYFVNPLDELIDATLRTDIKKEFNRYYQAEMYPRLTSEIYSPIYIQRQNSYAEPVFDLVKESNNIEIPSSVLGDPTIPVPLQVHGYSPNLRKPLILEWSKPHWLGVESRPFNNDQAQALILPNTERSGYNANNIGIHELTHASDIYLPESAGAMYENIAYKLGFGYPATELRATTNDLRYLLFKNNLNVDTTSDQELLKLFKSINSEYTENIFNNAQRLNMSDEQLADLLRQMVRILPAAAPLYFMDNNQEEK